MNRSEGKSLVEQKVEDFSRNKETYLHKSFNETEARDRFIDPLFRALGWEFDQTHLKRHLWDVHREYSQKEKSSTKKPDYAFRVDGKLKFFVEAKAPWIPLTDKKPVFQAKRYAFSTSGKAPIIVLTDFEEFRVFNAMERPVFDNPLQGLLKQFDLHYSNYTENWDLLYDHFSKQAVADGSLDKLRKKLSRNTKPLDEEFLTDITKWREMLARNIAVRNLSLTVYEINEAVQRILDRLIFIRNLEDRQIEDEGLLLKITEKKTNIYSELLPIFHRMGSEYNGLLFNKHFSEELTVDDKIIRTIIKKMCWPQSPFQFDVIEPEILGRIYEKFLGSKIRLTPSHHAKVEEKPEVRHAGGVYYTPQYIVDYIVKNTVGKKIEGKSPDKIQNIKIIDPACGSGSFLLGAFDLLMEYHRKWYGKNRNYRKFMNDYFETQDGEIQLTLRKKADILKNNIFGVDIDREATEVAMMSIYLKLLGEGFDKGQALLFLKGNILPDLSDNIKCGNSLIGSDFYDRQNLSLFENDELKRINAFDWKMEFPNVFENGGFDCVISNPPYIRIQVMKEWVPREVEYYKKRFISASKGNYDIYVVFVEKGLNLLSDRGRMGFILPHKFFNAKYGEPLRGLLAKGKHLSQIIHFGDQQVFAKATTYTCLLFLNKRGQERFRFVKARSLSGWHRGEPQLEGDVSVDKVTAGEWNFVVGPGASLFERLSDIPMKLGDVARIFQGLVTGTDKVFILEKVVTSDSSLVKVKDRNGEEWILEKGILKPFIKGVTVSSFSFPEYKHWIIFPYYLYDGTAKLITSTELDYSYPKVWEYLKSKANILRDRERGKWNNERWYAFGRTQNLTQMNDPKLIVQVISLTGKYAYDGSGIYFTGGGNGPYYGIRWLDVKDPHSLYYLQALLNSPLLDFYLHHISSPFRGGYWSYGKRFIERLPIRTIDFSSERDKIRHDQMVDLVNQMLSSHKQLQKVKTEHDRNIIQRKIDIMDRQIDQLVYELYGLSEEEIGLIEQTADK